MTQQQFKKIPLAHVQAVVNYLGRQPYGEVAEMIAALINAEDIKEADSGKSKKADG